MLSYMTAGESHGKALIALINGVPAGLALSEDFISLQLQERQKGYGRGGRMQIETDSAELISGVRKGITIGSPISILIKNRDFRIDEAPEIYIPRPGHADLAGALKYGHKDIRNVLERASARETAARVAAGAVAKAILSEFGIKVFGYVLSIGSAKTNRIYALKDIKAISASVVRCPDINAEKKMKQVIDAATANKDTLGGVFEIRAVNVPAGLGSYAQWNTRLDGALAGALMSIQGVKGVEIGAGFRAASLFGSKHHDAILAFSKGKITRKSNNAGGLEGGLSNGSEIVVRAAMKPIATLYNPLASVDLRTKKKAKASIERSDICAVPAACVVGESVVAFELATALLSKCGGDSMAEVKRNFEAYLNAVKAL
ncbi:MAG: chorismate synthase [Candidatus Firestonebacteria bacterium]